jgi:hypothetical protein
MQRNISRNFSGLRLSQKDCCRFPPCNTPKTWDFAGTFGNLTDFVHLPGGIPFMKSTSLLTAAITLALATTACSSAWSKGLVM